MRSKPGDVAREHVVAAAVLLAFDMRAVVIVSIIKCIIVGRKHDRRAAQRKKQNQESHHWKYPRIGSEPSVFGAPGAWPVTGLG
jgi:hypothetical protein